MLERDSKILISVCIVVKFLCDGFDWSLVVMLLFLIADIVKSRVNPIYGKFGIMCLVVMVFISVYQSTDSLIRLFIK